MIKIEGCQACFCDQNPPPVPSACYIAGLVDAGAPESFDELCDHHKIMVAAYRAQLDVAVAGGDQDAIREAGMRVIEGGRPS